MGTNTKEEESTEDPAENPGAFSEEGMSGPHGALRAIPLIEAPVDFAWKITNPLLKAIKGTDKGHGFGTFELNLNRGLAEQLGPYFDSLSRAPLTPENIAKVPFGAEGAYALYLDGVLAYVGKSNSKRGLGERLARHRCKLSNRLGISPSQVEFKAAQIYSFSAFDVESLLLLLAQERRFKLQCDDYKLRLVEWERESERFKDESKPVKPKKKGKSLEEHQALVALHEQELMLWREGKSALNKRKPKKPKFDDVKPPYLNNSGFGSNDTGEERDTQKTSRFDEKFPLDLDSWVDAYADAKHRRDLINEKAQTEPRCGEGGRCNLLQALDWFSENVSFTFRLGESRKEPDLPNLMVQPRQLLAAGPMREVLSRISALLSDEWQITVLKGRVLLHKKREEFSDSLGYFAKGEFSAGKRS
ncbi:MAG: hypothetical protein GAKPKEKM_01513 [Rhodocyclaceae bacterium]|nr:hypothetical protein [Rhodocyclaceae bacterium]